MSHIFWTQMTKMYKSMPYKVLQETSFGFSDEKKVQRAGFLSFLVKMTVLFATLATLEQKKMQSCQLVACFVHIPTYSLLCLTTHFVVFCHFWLGDNSIDHCGKGFLLDSIFSILGKKSKSRSNIRFRKCNLVIGKF